MTTYTFKILKTGDSTLYSPANLTNSQIKSSEQGQPFNVQIQQAAYSPTYGYILTESLLVITTESLLGLESE